MMDDFWKNKGRGRADELCKRARPDNAGGAARSFLRAGFAEDWCREDFADLLAAARWGALDQGYETEAHADEAVGRALALLVEGFNEQLKELAWQLRLSHYE